MAKHPSAPTDRSHAQAYKYAGDALAKNQGDKPWLAEMYGYAFGAAKADVWHRWDNASMIYPGYAPQGKLLQRGVYGAWDAPGTEVQLLCSRA